MLWCHHESSCTAVFSSGFRASGLVGAYMIMFVYFLTVWFEGVKRSSAFEAGFYLLPLVFSMVIGSTAAGGLTCAIGYYTPVLLIGTYASVLVRVC
jgi:hypothetical protein